MPSRRDRTGCYRKFAVEEFGVGDAANVPQLQKHAATGFVDRLGDVFPPLHLCTVPNAGCAPIADALRRHGGRFAQDQTGSSSLPIVFRHHGVRNALDASALAGERCHDDAVGQLEGANLQRIEQTGHLQLLWTECRYNRAQTWRQLRFYSPNRILEDVNRGA